MSESFDDYFYRKNGYYPAARSGKQYFEWLESEFSATQQKLEAAEARIKASQEQGLRGYQMRNKPSVFYVKEFKPTDINNFDAVYAAPVIPPDVAELQREIEQLRAHVNVVERQRDSWMESNAKRTEQVDELTKLLAEAKRKAVPEGWQLVPRISTHKMFRAFNFELPVSISDSVFFSNAYNAMLAAAPQPETDIDQAQRFK